MSGGSRLLDLVAIMGSACELYGTTGYQAGSLQPGKKMGARGNCGSKKATTTSVLRCVESASNMAA